MREHPAAGRGARPSHLEPLRVECRGGVVLQRDPMPDAAGQRVPVRRIQVERAIEQRDRPCGVGFGERAQVEGVGRLGGPAPRRPRGGTAIDPAGLGLDTAPAAQRDRLDQVRRPVVGVARQQAVGIDQRFLGPVGLDQQARAQQARFRQRRGGGQRGVDPPQRLQRRALHREDAPPTAPARPRPDGSRSMREGPTRRALRRRSPPSPPSSPPGGAASTSRAGAEGRRASPRSARGAGRPGGLRPVRPRSGSAAPGPSPSPWRRSSRGRPGSGD